MLSPFSDAILTRDVPEHDLRAGDVGTVVEVHRRPDGTIGYSIEFFDMTGRTVTVATIPAGAVREPTEADLPNVRRRTGA
jgi:hypothetical protein